MFDTKTVVFSFVITNTLITLFIASLWYQNRKRYAGLLFWLMDYILQAVGLLLSLLRDVAPPVMSIIVGNTLMMTGALLMLMGLERFVGRPRSQTHNYFLLAGFVCLMLYFTFAQPDISTRTVILSAVIMLLTLQCGWLMLRRVEPPLRSITGDVGFVFLLYALAALVRIVVLYRTPLPATISFFESPALQVVFLLFDQILSITLTFALILMLNRRLFLEIQSQEERFSKAFRSSPYAITLTRLSDGHILEVNDGFVNFSGYQVAEVMGKTTLDLHLWAKEEDRACVADELLKSNRVQGMEFQFLKKSGENTTGLYSAEIITINDQPCILSSISDITERKRAEEALRLQSAALEAAANGIVITDQAGTVLWTNPAFTALTGYTTEEAIGQNPRILKSGLHAPAFYQTLWQTILSGLVWHDEVMNRRKDGSLYVEEMTITPVRSTGGEITHFVAIKQDVTERKWTENKLQETKDQLEAILQGVVDGINVSDTAGQLVYVNNAAARAAGYPTAQAMLQAHGVGRLYERFDILDESGQPFPIAQLPGRLALQGKQTQSATLCHRSKATGEEKWSVVQAMPILDENGQVRFVVAITHDITERKRAEEVLARHDRAMAALYETSLEINSQPNAPTLLYAIVRRAAELLETHMGGLYLMRPNGQTLELVVSHNLSRDHTGIILHLGEGLSGRIAQTGEPMMVDDHLHWDGRAGVYADMQTRRVLGVPLKVGDRVIGVINVADDQKTGPFDEDQVRLLSLFADQAAVAVENARLVEALRQQTIELQARNEELDAFAHTVAHDLKTPLSLVIGYAELLGEVLPQGDELRRQLHSIVWNGRKMSSIIDDLLLLAETRSGEVDRKPLDMASIVSEAQQRLADMAEQSHAEIVLLDVSTWPVALGYAPWVEEVWANYLSNALKYGGRPPCVELGAEVQPDGPVRFWVRDNGPGILPEDQVRLFTPFTRLDQVHVKGHGLGLSIVRRIVEKLGGQVGVESQVGQGSVFSFTLPGRPASS